MPRVSSFGSGSFRGIGLHSSFQGLNVVIKELQFAL
jgi:hypothetical protein